MINPASLERAALARIPVARGADACDDRVAAGVPQRNYPVTFRKPDLVLITKIDLLPHLSGVRFGSIVDALGRVMPGPRYIAISATTGDGMER